MTEITDILEKNFAPHGAQSSVMEERPADLGTNQLGLGEPATAIPSEAFETKGQIRDASGLHTPTASQPALSSGGAGEFYSVANATAAALTDSEEYRVNEANRRLQILDTYKAMLVSGRYTKAAACRELQTGYATIWRWGKSFEKKGFNGLLPDTDKCGRKSIIEKLGVPQAVIDQIQGLNLDTDSTTAALRLYAQSDRCPEDLAKVILDPNRCSKHALPPSLRREVGVNANQRKAHRGPRQLALGGMWTPRKLDILPGDIFSADDTTPIWAWWVPWETSEEYPFGVKLLQGQFLPVIDVASQAVVTFALIAREKSSYRASDIWALFGHTFETVGVPRLGFQLERGSWEANMIAGQELEYAAGELTLSRRVGGLRQLPTNITPWHKDKLGSNIEFPKTLQTWTSYLPKSKSVEAFFNRSQTLEGTLWGALGRDQMRKPFEKMKKLFQECSRPRTKTDPTQHFLSQIEITARIMEMYRYLNNEPMEGEVFHGIPQQKFDQARQEYPLLHLPEEDRWLYRRSWKPTTITQNWARVRLTHELSGTRYSLFYTHPEIFSKHEGEDIVVYYDLENFEAPAQIILARTGEYLCEAQYEDRKGSFLQGDCSGHDIRKRWKSAVMTAYGTIVKHAPSRQLPPEIQARREAAKVIENGKRQETAPITVQRFPQATAPRQSQPVIPQRDPAELQRQRERLERQAQRAKKLIQFEG